MLDTELEEIKKEYIKKIERGIVEGSFPKSIIIKAFMFGWDMCLDEIRRAEDKRDGLPKGRRP